MATSSRKVLRRSSEEVRTLVLAAARDLFSKQGYEATTMRAISEQAGVSFPLVFSNFGSKAELFEAAVMDPFTELVEGYVTEWRTFTQRGETAHAITARFVRTFYQLVRANRILLLTCAARHATGGTGPDIDLVPQFAAMLLRLRQIAITEAPEHGWSTDPPAGVAASMGSILGTALLDDLLFPPKTRRPGTDRIVNETVNMILYGITGPPAAEARHPGSTPSQTRTGEAPGRQASGENAT